MFMSCLTLACILAITYKIDHKTLRPNGKKLQLISYYAIFAVGFIGVAAYLFDPALPSPLALIQGQFKPIGAWDTP